MKIQKEVLTKEFNKLSDKMVDYPNKFSINDLDLMAKIASVLTVIYNMGEEAEEIEEEAKDDIKDELMGAQEYWNRYLKEEDASYKNMAKDELRHAEFFINKASADGVDPGEIRSKIDWYNSLLSEINRQGN